MTCGTDFDTTAIRRAITVCEPRAPELPSTWAERERVLDPRATPQPGRWSNDYLPWIRHAGF